MKKILNNIIKSLLPVALGAVILYWIYCEFDFSSVWVALGEMDMFFFVLSLFFGVYSHVLRGLRWRLTLAPLGYYPRRDNCVYSIFIAYAANLVLPRVGEVSRCVVIDRSDNVPLVQSLGTVVTERLIDTLMVIAITVVAVLLQWDVFERFLVETGGGFSGASGGSWLQSAEGTVILVLSAVAFAVLVVSFLRRMSVWVKIRLLFNQFVEGMLSLMKMKNGALFVVETVGIWFCYFMQFYLCFFCFPFSSGLSLAAGLLLFVAGSIAVVVPTPNGAGPWHFAVISIMVIYGVSSTDASLFALIVHSSQTLLVALLGIVGLVALRFNNSIKTKK